VKHPKTNGQPEATNKVILKNSRRSSGKLKVFGLRRYPIYCGGYHCIPQSFREETSF